MFEAFDGFPKGRLGATGIFSESIAPDDPHDCTVRLSFAGIGDRLQNASSCRVSGKHSADVRVVVDPDWVMVVPLGLADRLSICCCHPWSQVEVIRLIQYVD